MVRKNPTDFILILLQITVKLMTDLSEGVPNLLPIAVEIYAGYVDKK